MSKLVQILVISSKCWLSKVKIDQSFGFIGKKIQNFRLRSKLVIILVFRSKLVKFLVLRSKLRSTIVITLVFRSKLVEILVLRVKIVLVQVKIGLILTVYKKKRIIVVMTD